MRTFEFLPAARRTTCATVAAGRLSAVMALGLLALAGCGGGGGDASPPPAPTPVLSLFAGNADGRGSADGIGAAARFRNPQGMAFDAAGVMYVADQDNYVVRKVTPAGAVTTFAGSAGAWGYQDGTGAAATFSQIGGVATDRAGNVYVADSATSIIRRITPAGVVTTLAGSGYRSGSSDGVGAAARFGRPMGVAADSAGNIYVADWNNHNIRKITPAGVVTTFAGTAGATGSVDGLGTAARFYGPQGIAVDSADNVYVADTYNATLRKITPAGEVTTIAGMAGVAGSADGNGAAARFQSPHGIAFDGAGNLYVADTYNGTVRKMTPAGDVTTLAGTAGAFGYADGTGAAARFNYPFGLGVDAAGNVFVGDSWNNVIRRVTPAGVTTTFLGTVGISGSSDGTGVAARFYDPFGMAADRAGNIYIADWGNHTVRKATPGGVVTTVAGTAGQRGNVDGPAATARLNYPAGIAVDAANNLFVADYGSSTIRRITPAGEVTTLAGSGTAGSGDGTGSAASFKQPYALALDSAGNVFVADTGNYTIRKVTPAGVVTTFAGTAGQIGATDGTGAAARFYFPSGIVIDRADNLYVSDMGLGSIRKITPAGVVTTFVSTNLDTPIGLALGATGDLYVADSGYSTISKITPAGVLTTLVGQKRAAGFMPGNLPGLIADPGGMALVGTTLYFTTNNGIGRVTDLP